MSIRSRFLALFLALVIAPILLVFLGASLISSNLARRSLEEYERESAAGTEADLRRSLDDLARLEERSLAAVERRAAGLAEHAERLFRDRAACERSGKWRDGRLRETPKAWVTEKGDGAGYWIPKAVDVEAARRDLPVMAHIEDALLALRPGGAMTQWYAITETGAVIIVPYANLAEESFDPRKSLFYEPATPAQNPAGGVIWTDLYNDPAGQGVMISCIAPIGRGASFQGIAGVDVNVRDFGADIRDAAGFWDFLFLLDGKGRVLLVEKHGLDPFGFREPEHRREQVMEWTVDRISDARLREACAAMPSTPSGLTRGVVAGRDRFLAHRRLGNTGWILAAAASPDRVLGSVAAMRRTQADLFQRLTLSMTASAVILLLAGFLFAAWLTHRVTRPIRSLADAARAIGAGHPETVLGPGGPDEIGTLADTLRTMVRDRETAQKAIAEAQKLSALGGMASGICHELNNLLSPILGFAQVLRRAPLTEAQSEQVERIERAARAAREIVASLLDSTREIAGARASVDLNEVAREAVGQLAPSARDAGVEVAWDLDASLPRTLANASLLQRVFFNVADNAIRAMKDSTRPARVLFVRSRVEGARLVFTFDDDGPGIAAEHLNRVFDPFFTTRPPGSGTGLGLSVATSAVRAHGGSIAAQNRQGGGARFIVFIPRVAPSDAPADTVRAPTGAPAPGSARRRILVVDDEDSIRILVRHTLEGEMDVVLSDSGKEALSLIGRGGFDAVLCDLRLRDLSGRDIYAWIRANRPEMLKRFLVITGDTHGEETRAFLEEFGTPCLTKPFDLDELTARVREILGRERSPVGGS